MEAFNIDFAVIAAVGGLLPLLCTIACVVISLVLHFNDVTKTHCKVANYLPSISAATGDFSPEKYIWRIGIAYHSSLRLISIASEYHLFNTKASAAKRTTRLFNILNKFNCALYTTEDISLVTLTYVSADENYSVHEKSFIVFMVTSMLHMIIACVLYYWTCQSPATNQETSCLRKKVIALLVNCCSFAIAIYLFFRHHWYCEAGVYSMFAFFEYMAVFSNIYFHYLIKDDFQGARLKLVDGSKVKKQ